MTAPVTTDALVEAGCRAVYGKNWDGPADKAPGEAMRKVWRDLVAKAQAPLLAAHQQVTAERDEAQQTADIRKMQVTNLHRALGLSENVGAYRRIDEMEAEAASLRAEVEAKAVPPGWQLVPREPDSRMKAELAAAVGGNWDIGHDAYVRALAVAPKPALARAATAGEGRSDG